MRTEYQIDRYPDFQMNVRARPSLRSLALAVALAQGCASPPPDVRHPDELGAIAVVAGTTKPELSFRGFRGGKAEGALVGAGYMFLQCNATLPPTCGGAMCGAVLVVWLGVCGTGMVVGAVAGAEAYPSAATARESEAVTAKLQVDAMQEALREQVIGSFSAHGRGPVDLASADTLAVVSLSRVGLNPEANPYIISAEHQLYMHATVRLLRRSDWTELSTTEYVHTGPKHTLEAWSENSGARLLDGLKVGYEALGAHIHDSVFLLYPFPAREWNEGSHLFVPVYGLAPIEPWVLTPWLTLVRVASLQPTLSWQAFPREVDVAAAPQDMARVRNVRYELVIAREHQLAPAEIVYRREALPRPEHTLETPLAPGTNYFWTVRARFELDGRERVTPWGSTHLAPRETWTVPSRYTYRFSTP
jgi:hypothetical protein